MTKQIKEKIKTVLKDKSREELESVYVRGIVYAEMLEDDELFTKVVKEMFLVRQELKHRNIKVIKVKGDTSLSFRFVPLVDTRAKGPVTMTIPSVRQLIEGPIQPDLPAHGYITNHPIIHLT